MRLAYVDETYDQFEFVLGAIFVPPDSCVWVSNWMRYLQREVFGTDEPTPNTEFHASLLFNGKKQFEGMSMDRRAELVRQILVYVAMHTERLYAICFDLTDRYEIGILDYVERMNLLASEMLLRAGDGLIVVADYDEQSKKRTAGLFGKLRQHGSMATYERPPAEGLLDAIHYVHSHESPALQATDVALYVLRRYLNRAEHAPAAWEQPFWDFWEQEFVGTDRLVFRHWPEQFESGVNYDIQTGIRPKLPRPNGR